MCSAALHCGVVPHCGRVQCRTALFILPNWKTEGTTEDANSNTYYHNVHYYIYYGKYVAFLSISINQFAHL